MPNRQASFRQPSAATFAWQKLRRQLIVLVQGALLGHNSRVHEGGAMRTTLDIASGLLQEAMSVSGSRSKRAAVCWALQEAVRRKAIRDLLARKVKIEFAVTPAELEAWEVQRSHGLRPACPG
jgi:Arc/MetJ family transcription regulator